MKSLVFQFVTIASSFLLALPNGWCSGLSDGRTESAPAQVACCLGADHQESSAPQQSRDQPSADCCCSWDATLPHRSVQPDDLSMTALPTAADDWPPCLHGRTNGKAIDVPDRSDPPLHVLQCVWLC